MLVALFLTISWPVAVVKVVTKNGFLKESTETRRDVVVLRTETDVHEHANVVDAVVGMRAKNLFETTKKTR